jgi:hypothetical protein
MFTSLISLSSGENRRRLSSALETKEKRERETNQWEIGMPVRGSIRLSTVSTKRNGIVISMGKSVEAKASV